MNDINTKKPLYNSRIHKTYLEYIKKYHPEINIKELLDAAGMKIQAIEDTGAWFTQEQANKFNKKLVELTNDPEISRKAGRYTVSSDGMGPIRQFATSFLSLDRLYLALPKTYRTFSHSGDVKAKKIHSNKVILSSTPCPGVKEEPYQCLNRLGVLESLGHLFSYKYSNIEHTECLHKGASKCVYIISWEKELYIQLKLIRNYFSLFSANFIIASFFMLKDTLWSISSLTVLSCNLILTWIASHLELKSLYKNYDQSRISAWEHLKETTIRYNNALLIQEMGEATSSIIKINPLLEKVLALISQRLSLQKGFVFLNKANSLEQERIVSFGYKDKEKKIIPYMLKDLSNKANPFKLVVQNKKDFLLDVNNKNDKETFIKHFNNFSLQKLKSAICIPLKFKNNVLGAIYVESDKTILTQTDLNLIKGIATNTATSIMQIKESQKEYRDLVENASSIILRHDSGGKIIFINQFGSTFFAYTEHELLGSNIFNTIFRNTDETREQYQKLIKRLAANPNKAITVERENITANRQTVTINWTYKPILNNRNEVKEYLCIGNDVSELKQMQTDKQKLYLQLENAKKMEAIGTLAGGVAHDLNNILSGIVGYPELLLMELPEDSPFRSSVEIIKNSGERAAAVVQDLLTLARRGVKNKKIIQLNRIIDEYINSPEHQKIKASNLKVKTQVEQAKDVHPISGSSVHLWKTIMNLVLNAYEAMPDGGIVKIRTYNEYLDSPTTIKLQLPEGQYTVLEISDTGIGIKEEDIKRIFEPFYTKKVMGRSGTGLGMAVVWGTVKDHDGNIDLDSHEGEGTTFSLYFPASQGKETEEILSMKKLDVKGNGEKVLIIDDEKHLRELASNMLKRLGFAPTSVNCGEDAIEYLKNNPVDIIVLDMIMDPGIDGLDTYKGILKINPRQKVLIASGYSETDRVKEAFKLGINTMIKKPYTLQTLGQAICHELDNK